VSRRKNTSTRHGSRASVRCPVAVPALSAPLPRPQRALNLLAAAVRRAAGLPGDLRRLLESTAPGARATATAPVAPQPSGELPTPTAPSDAPPDTPQPSCELPAPTAPAEAPLDTPPCAAPRAVFEPAHWFAVASAAMAVPLADYEPPVRPPLDSPPKTPPAEPLPLNGLLWSALGRTAMVVDGLDLSPAKLQELESLAKARTASAVAAS
jgi:hypothetical protein